MDHKVLFLILNLIHYVKEKLSKLIYLKHLLVLHQNMVLNSQYENKCLELVALFAFQ